MLSTPDGPFINLARLNFSKYAARPNLAKALFEYIFHHENDIRNVSELSELCVIWLFRVLCVHEILSEDYLTASHGKTMSLVG